jgi:hypothetical protein
LLKELLAMTAMLAHWTIIVTRTDAAWARTKSVVNPLMNVTPLEHAIQTQDFVQTLNWLMVHLVMTAFIVPLEIAVKQALVRMRLLDPATLLPTTINVKRSLVMKVLMPVKFTMYPMEQFAS